MATYAEMAAIIGGATLKDRMAIAVVDAANAVVAESTGTTGHALRLAWAQAAISDPMTMAVKMQPSVVVQNKAATQAQILAATDAQLLIGVQTAINAFAGVAT